MFMNKFEYLVSWQVLISVHPSAKGPCAALNWSGQHPKVAFAQGSTGTGLQRFVKPDKSAAVMPVVIEG